MMSATPSPSRSRKIPPSEVMVVSGGMASLSSQIMMLSGWSSRFSPTPGRSCCTSIPRSSSWRFGPIPERRRRRGVSIAPAQRSISVFAARVREWPGFRVMFTLSAFFLGSLERFSLETHASVRTVRFGCFSSPLIIGWRYATLAELLFPSSGL